MHHHIIILFPIIFMIYFFTDFIDKLLNIESYLNYQDIDMKPIENNCPQIHYNNNEILLNKPQSIQYFGYTKNQLFDMTRFIIANEPLPTDPDFFKNI